MQEKDTRREPMAYGKPKRGCSRVVERFEALGKAVSIVCAVLALFMCRLTLTNTSGRVRKAKEGWREPTTNGDFGDLSGRARCAPSR